MIAIAHHTTRWLTIVLLVTIALLWCAAGCGGGPARQLRDSETQPLAWLVEDLCHGLPRHSAELLRTDASQPLQRIAVWLGAATQDEDLPDPVATRRARWRLLGGGLRAGALRCDADGQLSLDAGAARELRDALGPAVASENHDRSQTEVLVLAQAGLASQAKRAAQVIATLRAARVHHARETGGPACLLTPNQTPTPGPAPSTDRRIGLP